MKTVIAILAVLLILGSLGYSQYPRNQRISAAEYFINTDPSEGNGINIPLSDPLWEVPITTTIPDPPIGSRIYVRVKSTNGTWSAPRCIKRLDYFTHSGSILAYGEYFINTDPGLGNGKPVTIEPDGSINLYNLPLKLGNKVYIRLKDNFERWGPARAVTFNFKDMYQAVYYIKYQGGGQSSSGTMLISSPNDSSNLFIAYKDTIPVHNNDTVLVRFQTIDRFYSQWTPLVIIFPSSQPTFDPGIINFNQLHTGDTVKRTLIITNKSITPFRIDSIVVSNSSFTTSLNLPFTINQSDTIRDTVTFIPIQSGGVHDSLIIWMDLNKKQIIRLEALVTSVGDEKITSPLRYELSQNYPNPFNPSTTIKYALPQASHVNLSVFNTLGQRVALLMDGKQEAGYHEVNFDASGFTSGVYFYRLQAGDPSTSSGQRFMETKKLILMK